MRNPFTPATPVAKKLKILIYGDSGVGKTIAALTFPRVALIDTEGGTDLYAGRPGIKPFSVLRVKTLAEVESALAFIEQDNGRTFETLVIDPITVIYDVVKAAAEAKSKDNEMSYREWGSVNNKMKALYTRLTNLPVHVIATAREAVEYEGTGKSLRRVGFKPDADKTIKYIMDFVVRMTPDRTGVLEKSRGMDLARGGLMPAVNWAAFEIVANAYTDGDDVLQKSEDEAALVENTANEFSDQSIVKAFLAHWEEKSISRVDCKKALLIKLPDMVTWADWKFGRAAADEAVQAWHNSLLDELDKKSVPFTAPPTEPAADDILGQLQAAGDTLNANPRINPFGSAGYRWPDEQIKAFQGKWQASHKLTPANIRAALGIDDMRHAEFTEEEADMQVKAWLAAQSATKEGAA